MTTRIKLRRDTAANWSANNPILALGEPGLDTTNNSVKYGDGITHWNSLTYSGEGATENVWIATLSSCANSFVKVSRDGVKWTEAFKPMPRLFFGGWQNFWYAKPLGGKVIYDMYVDYLGDETLGWSDNALDYPNPATFTNSPTDADIDTRDWWDVLYVNGKFIAVGGFFEEGSTDVERPMFAISDDGKTWTYGVIDQTYISNLVSDADADPTGVRITSVAYNGVGYLFALEWDHQFGGSYIGGLAPGFFYVTSLSATLNASNHISPTIDNNAGLKGLVWNNDHWAAYGHQNVWDRASLFVNTNLNPNTGTWTEISVSSTTAGSPQLQVFGCSTDYGNTLAAFTTGKIGDYYWDVLALNNGRVMATKDKGVTWIGSVPFNLYNPIDTVYYDGTNTRITFDVPNFDGGYYSPQEGERIDIRYGNVEQLRGIFYLGAETDADGPWREWTIFSDKALTTPVNSSSWAESYDHSGNNGYAVITFSRDSDASDPITFGGFDQVKIADGKIVAINGAAWACSTDLLEWTLSLNTDVFTSYAYGTSDLEWGTAGSTNRSSLTYVSDSNLALEAVKDDFLGSSPSKDNIWWWEAMGNYVNQLVLAENFKVTIGGTGLTQGYSTPMSMGMEPTGKWWIGHDNWQEDEFGTFTPTSIAAEDWDGPGFADIVIRTDTGNNDYEWVFDRDGVTHFPGLTIDTQVTVPNARVGGNTQTLALGILSGGRVAITGPMADYYNHDAPELIIAGRDSYYDGNSSTFVGEGGDLYLWAGKGGNGGDIKIDAGEGVGTSQVGGYVKIRAGHNTGTSGVGGFVHIEAGLGNSMGGSHGDVVISTVDNANSWTFGADANLTLPTYGEIKKAGGQSTLFKASGTLLSMVSGGTLTAANAHFTIRTVDNTDSTYSVTFASTTPTQYSWAGTQTDMTGGTNTAVHGVQFTATANTDYAIGTALATVGDTLQAILTDYTSGHLYRITVVLTSTSPASSSISIEQIA